MLDTLCKREQGVNKANKVLLTVTEEERRIARELSEENYQMMPALERAEARKEGRNEGINAGRQEGLKQGTYQSKLETAKAFKKMGILISQIAKGSGLSEEEIEKL